MSLSDIEVRKSKPGEKPYKLADSRGMFLLITPAGGKLWRLKYRFGGAEKLMALGRYPDITLAQARERRDEARKQLAEGIDPMAERKGNRDPKSGTPFSEVAELWLAHWSPDKTSRHARTVKERIKANILPAIGSRPVSEIEAPELVAMAQSIQARGANEVAKRVLQTSGQIFRFAITHGHAKRNPAADFEPTDALKAYKTKNQARVEVGEFPALLRDIQQYKGRYATRQAMQLMALTFVRTSELIGAEWQEFDFEKARWTIPAARMKMRRPHIVPLSRQAIKVLDVLRPFTGSEKLLFLGDHDRNKSMSSKAIMQALEIMGYKGRMTGHGFRGLASTILHEQGYNHDHIELQLAHAPKDSASSPYNYALYLEPRTLMMQEWADFLDAQLESAAPKPSPERR